MKTYQFNVSHDPVKVNWPFTTPVPCALYVSAPGLVQAATAAQKYCDKHNLNIGYVTVVSAAVIISSV